ncbi:MAG: serine hydrolase domain-containing protein [Syntrophothermus sp.]
MSHEMIEVIEEGLLPANTIQGRPQPGMSLAERMKRYNVPGVSIALIDRSAIAGAQGYGVEQAGEDSPVTARTRFQAASISKPVTALAVLQLVQNGTLDLDADVNRYLRSWQVPDNEHTQERKVTLRGLLSHTAGLGVHGFPGYAADEAVPSLCQILDGQPPANTQPVRVETVPGSQWSYSGGGYIVMQQVLEDITGKPFPALMRSTVLDPLQMEHSTFEQPLPAHHAGEAATAHRGDGLPIDGKWHTYPEMAAAGLWTTPTDLARYVIEIIQSSAGRSNRLLSLEITSEMLTPVLNNHGLGPRVEKIRDSLQYSHGGGNAGFRCFMVGYPGLEQGAVVMTNGDNGDVLMMEIMRGIARAFGWPHFHPAEKTIVPVDPGLYHKYEGDYRLVGSPEYGSLIRREHERLIMESLPDGVCYELHPASETQFFSEEHEETFDFVEDENGRVNTLMIASQWKMERVK